MSAQIIPFPRKYPVRAPALPSSELALDRFAEALIQRAARRGITLSANNVKLMVATLAAPAKKSEIK
jgi:hypothetical protein